MKQLLIIAATALCVGLLQLPVAAYAQEDTSEGETPEKSYQLLSDIPGLQAVSTSGDFSELVNSLYRMSIGIGTALAVIMLVFAGLKYAASEKAGEKELLRHQITMVIGGLVLLVGAYTFLEIINPDLLNLANKEEHFEDIDYTKLEEFEPPTEVMSNVVVPTYPGEVKTFYVALDEDGNEIEGAFYRTEEECLEESGAEACKKKTNSQVSFGGVEGGPAAIALSELQVYGKFKEHEDILCDRIRDYAKLVTGSRSWNCTSRKGQGPWSALFISFVMNQGGLLDFPKSTSHWVYIKKAALDQNGLRAHPFGGLYQPKPGDLLCTGRGWSEGEVNFTNILEHKGFPSHCDIVIENMGDFIIGVGGNKSNNIEAQDYPARDGVPLYSDTAIAIIRI